MAIRISDAALKVVSSIVKSQVRLSSAFDSLLPAKYVTDGNQDFINNFVPTYVSTGLLIYDIGGGKNPYLGREQKTALQLKVVGLDICQEELGEAPAGVYDEKVCADITEYRGKEDADLVICQALLEHVKDTRKAFRGIASTLKPGGLALIFVPSRNAAFARLNIVLPHKLKQKILYTIFPNTRKNQGFPSYYDKCTPREFRMLALDNNLWVHEEQYYYTSSYFSFFFPLYVVWRLWILAFASIQAGRLMPTLH
jgi:SAM-dependent methyltransferase